MFVTVCVNDFKEFVEENSFEWRFTCDYYNGDLELQFSAPEDYEKALKWVYARYGEHIYINGILQATVSYDADKAFYWHCNINNEERSGFATPTSALENCEEYLEKLNYTKEQYLKDIERNK